jgi:hypothetical protein
VTLDEIERLAQAALNPPRAADFSSAAEARRAIAAERADREPDLASAVLAMLPVVRAAEAWRERGPGQSHCDEEDCPCTSTVCRLKKTIDAMRSALER